MLRVLKDLDSVEDSEELRLENVERRSMKVQGESVTIGYSVAEILRQEGVERVRK
jgi:hypothetical protein